MPLAQVSQESYPEFIRLDAATPLIGLLSHENTDIAIDAIEVLNEFIDDEVIADMEDVNEEEALAKERIFQDLVKVFVCQKLV